MAARTLRKSKTSGKNKKRQQSLAQRIIPNVGPNGSSKRDIVTEGYTVVNGKLLSASDVGVQLRKVAERIGQNSRVNVSKSTKRKNSKTPAVRVAAVKRKNVPATNHGKNWNHFIATGGPSTNQLVISTKIDASDKILVLYNLALGVKQDNLKSILEKLSNSRVAKCRVRDLPSGSATANVWLAKPTMEELERVRKLFDGALVDGRTIQVLIASDTSSKLAY